MMRYRWFMIVMLVLCAGYGFAQDWKTHDSREMDPKEKNVVRFVYPSTWSAFSTGGMGEATGPNGEQVIMGITATLITPEALEAMVRQQKAILAQSGMPPQQIDMLTQNLRQSAGPIGPQPFCSPADAVTRLFPLLAASQNKQLTDVRIVRSEMFDGNRSPMSSASFMVTYNFDGVAYRGLFNVSTSWITPGETWMYYTSGCSAPEERFDSVLPVMQTVWKSYLENSVRVDWAVGAVRRSLDAAEYWALEWGKALRRDDEWGEALEE